MNITGSDDVNVSASYVDNLMDNMATFVLDTEDAVMATDTMDLLSSSPLPMTAHVNLTSEVQSTPVISTDLSSVGNSLTGLSPSLPVTLTSSPHLASASSNKNSVYVSINPSPSPTVSLIEPTIFPSANISIDYTPLPTPAFDSSSVILTGNSVSSTVTPTPPLTSSQVSSTPLYTPSIKTSSVRVPVYPSTDMMSISPDSRTTAESSSENTTMPAPLPSPAASSKSYL